MQMISTRPWRRPGAGAARLAERVGDEVLGLIHGLGWHHDGLALELYRATQRLTTQTAATVGAGTAHDRQRHRRSAVIAAGRVRRQLELLVAVGAVHRDRAADVFAMLAKVSARLEAGRL